MTTKIINRLSIITLAIIMFAVVNATAQTYELRGTTRTQLRTLITSIENRTDAFKVEMQRSSRWGGTTNQEDRVIDFIEKFEDATDRLKQQADSRRPIGNELSDVFNRAQTINAFMIRNRLTGRAESLWASVRNDLNTLATYYQYNWSWDQAVTTYPSPGYPGTVQTYELRGATSRQLRTLINSIENRTDAYKVEMQRSSFGRTTNQEDRILDFIQKFEDSTDRLKQQADSRRPIGSELTDVFSRAQTINQFMVRNRLSGRSESLWASVRTDLNTLATYYQYSWNWDQTFPNTGGGYPGTGPIGGGNRNRFLTGTFRLNRSMSDNVANVIDRSLSNIAGNQRDNFRRNLERRLASPEMIAIDINGRMVELASSNAPRVSFEANGVAQSETNARGRTVKTTTTVDRTGLNISYEGDRSNDFYVTFSPRGDRLNVTRKLYLENQNESISVSSVYDRVSDNPDWSAVNSGPAWDPNNNTGGTIGGTDFYVPNGTRLTATLRGTVNTGASQRGDRFTMEVDTPSQYRGAIIEGTVAQAETSGRVTGRANISLNFDTIRFNGRSYRFAGIVDSVTALNGDRITVNNEGAIRDTNQTTQTVTRAGIGAALGAIIGAIAGGGSGAAIGAGVGAGVGAGSVLVTGRDTIELGPGSRFDITAYSPGGNRIGAN